MVESPDGATRARIGLYPPPPLLCVGVKAGFEVTDGFVAAATSGGALPAEYFDPEASATFCMIPSGVKSRSDLAVICT
jgi:hypothetical protein